MENNTFEGKILYRSNTNRVIFGVCGGLGEYFCIDPIIFRIIFIALTFGAGSGIIIYLLLAFIIPKNPSMEKKKEKKWEPIDVRNRINELVNELRELKNMKGEHMHEHYDHHHYHHRHNHGMFRLLLGFILLIIGFGLLIQGLHLLPGFYFDFSIFWNLWPVLIILLGLSLISKY